MKSKIWIILILVPVILAGAVVLSNKQTPSTTPSSIVTFSTQTNNENEVTVEVTPKVLSNNQPASFDILFNTHSVPLEFDLLKIAKLTDDQGNTYQPVSWTGESGGHHLSGTLTFAKISNAKSVELVITGIAGVDRTFKWEIAH